MTEEENKRQIEQIEVIYKNYVDQISELKKNQDKIINDFSDALKNKKIENIKKQLSSL
jgi:hypothetical protein